MQIIITVIRMMNLARLNPFIAEVMLIGHRIMSLMNKSQGCLSPGNFTTAYKFNVDTDFFSNFIYEELNSKRR